MNNLILIEDNAHGHGGSVNGKLLGTFGDIGFSSPRKLFSLNYGGVLYTKSKVTCIPKISKPQKIDLLKKTVKTKAISYIKPFLKYYKAPMKSTVDNYIPDLGIDNKSLNRLLKTDFKNEKNKRLSIYNNLENFVKRNGISPVIKNFSSDCIPWAFPVYIENQNKKDFILDFARKFNINVFSWPRLPNNLDETNFSAMNLKNQTIVFLISPNRFNRKILKDIE